VPEFKVLQAMWAMERRQPDGIEWSLPEKLTMIREAGYDGISISGAGPDRVRAAADFIHQHGMVFELQCFPETIDDLHPALALARETGALYVDLQPNIRPRTLLECVSLLRGWIDMAASEGVNLLIETHRDRMTTDLHFTLDLIDAVPDLRLLADLSHYLVAREFPDPPRAVEHEMIHAVLDRSWGLHGRVASREQVQIPISFKHHQQWVNLAFDWWRYGMASWLKRAKADDVLCFVCELGPQPYAISGADGYDLSDRWAEALTMKDRIRADWQNVNGAATAKN
jgi:hypothetical protein